MTDKDISKCTLKILGVSNHCLSKYDLYVVVATYSCSLPRQFFVIPIFFDKRKFYFLRNRAQNDTPSHMSANGNEESALDFFRKWWRSPAVQVRCLLRLVLSKVTNFNVSRMPTMNRETVEGSDILSNKLDFSDKPLR